METRDIDNIDNKWVEANQKLNTRRYRKEGNAVLVMNGATDSAACDDKVRNSNQIVNPMELFKPRVPVAA